ncbi:hypothetical protein J2785_002594 [Burkholderia ambifaria]|nr:hypothetical protein [Burkholderia ambifaria]MDR6499441.1 hypothetical protein [Burkholderia ambifaria]
MINRFFALITAILIGALSPTPSSAKCAGSINMPSQQVSITFKRNEISPSTEQNEKLKEWSKKVLSNYSIHQWLSVSAQAQPDEDNPDDLATSRAVSLTKLALDDGLVRAPIELKTRVGSFGNPASYGDEARTGTLQLTPGCPNNCCDGK